jgi:Fe-S-cluster-containing dehydrogenase component
VIIWENFMSKALLYDATLCIGCKQCEQACAEKNKLPYNETIAEEERQSDHKFTAVLTKGDKFMRTAKIRRAPRYARWALCARRRRVR